MDALAVCLYVYVYIDMYDYSSCSTFVLMHDAVACKAICVTKLANSWCKLPSHALGWRRGCAMCYADCLTENYFNFSHKPKAEIPIKTHQRTGNRRKPANVYLSGRLAVPLSRCPVSRLPSIRLTELATES